jgi:hypothetical protein
MLSSLAKISARVAMLAAAAALAGALTGCGGDNDSYKPPPVPKPPCGCTTG